MANLIKLTPGIVSAYANAGFTASDFNSRANGGFVLATSNIDNSSNLDLEAEVSGQLTVGGTTSAVHFLALWIMDRNRDGSTYGDGTPTGSTLPAAHYWRTSAQVRSGITSGNPVYFTFPPVRLPRGIFCWGISQHLGAALNAAAAANIEFRTTSLNTNG